MAVKNSPKRPALDNHIPAHSLFGYWRTPSRFVSVGIGELSAKGLMPIHVVISAGGGGWIPISVLVFATSPSDALARLRRVLVRCRDMDYTGVDSKRGQRALQFINAIDGKDGELRATAQQLRTDMIYAEVNWASNGGPL